MHVDVCGKLPLPLEVFYLWQDDVIQEKNIC